MSTVSDSAASGAETVRRQSATGGVGWPPIDLGIDEPGSFDAIPNVEKNRTPALRRVRKRRVLALPLAIALLAAGVKLVSITWIVSDGSAAYEAGRYVASRSAFNRLRFLNVIQPWRAWFDIGDARYRLGDLGGAETAFLRALAEDSGRCDVRFNLAVTIEAQGDRLMGDNVRDVTESETLDGLARYRVALDIVNGATCPIDGSGSAGYRLADTRERLEAKLGADQSLQDRSANEELDEEVVEEGEPADENQTLRDRIAERNQRGEAERQDASDINPTGDPQPGEPNW